MPRHTHWSRHRSRFDVVGRLRGRLCTRKIYGNVRGGTCRSAQDFTRGARRIRNRESDACTKKAASANALAHEIVPIAVSSRQSILKVECDELPMRAKVSKIPTLKPAFEKEGTITAASSSAISDGAAALMLTRLDTAARHGMKPIARVVDYAGHAQDPAHFVTAPILAAVGSRTLTRLKIERLLRIKVRRAGTESASVRSCWR